jgi:3-oxoacyl-[acyl-carrier-protein] synthase II
MSRNSAGAGKNRVYLLAAEADTALGGDLQSSWENLCRGKTAVRPIEHFDVSAVEFRNAAWSPTLRRGGTVREAAGVRNGVVGMVEQVVPPVASRLGEILSHSPDDSIDETFEGVAPLVIWAGAKGNAEYIEQGLPPGGTSLPMEYRALVARLAGIEAPPTVRNGMEINAACASSTVGVAVAAESIALGHREAALVCAADVVSRFTHMGFSSLKALTAEVPRPFDVRRDGLVLGDGAVCLLLGSERLARRMSRTGAGPMALITGWGCANDANHITGPARDGCGLIQAIRMALKRADRRPAEVSAFCTHGTSTVYNDSMELAATEALFGRRRFPMYSVKGALGHTLGAAGGIEVALSALSLREGRIPPTTGCDEPEDRAVGRIENRIQAISPEVVLTTNSGFGGVNAAVVMENPCV